MSFSSMLYGAVFMLFFFGFIQAIASVFVNRGSSDKTGREVTGHTSAEVSFEPINTVEKERLIMATPKLGYAFSEQPDWSEYDQPAYLRKKKALNAYDEVSKETQIEEASEKRQPSSKKTRMTPQEQLAEFKKNSKGRFSNGNYETL